MQIILAVVFVWYMHRRDCRYSVIEKHRDQVMQSREHSCHEFQRALNDNTLDAFKQVVKHLAESKTALDQSTRATMQVMRVLSRFQAVKPPEAGPLPNQGPHS
jgi:TPP-dependent 2-oxoacid decarboxylase